MTKKESLFVFLCFFVFLSFMPIFSQWARTYGDTGGDEWPYCVRQTSDGGYIVIGRTDSFGAGASDLWAAKLDWDGNIDWQYTYGGTSDDYAVCVQQTSDGGYIVAGTTNSFGAGSDDAWVLKLASNGAIEWQGTCGGTALDEAYFIQQTSDGGYIGAGTTTSFGAGGYDAWIVKLDSGGDIEWDITYGGTLFDFAYCIQETSDGGYIVASTTESFGAGGYDAWIVKLDSVGNINWQYTYGGTSPDYAISIQQTSDGGYIVAGTTESFGTGLTDIWILKLDSSGTVVWQQAYGGTSLEYVYHASIQETSDGGYIVGGRTQSFGQGGVDFLSLKLDSIGAIEWQYAYGGSQSDYGQGIQQTSDGGYIFSGDSTSFRPVPGTDYDWLILKLYPNGQINPSCGITEVSMALPSATSVSAAPTSVTSQDVIGVTPGITSVSPQSTSVSANTVCEAPKFDLTISVSGSGTTDPIPGTYGYYSGTDAQVEAIPYSGYRFNGWSGDASGKTNPLTITMDDIKSVIANFTAIPTHGDGDGGGRGLCFIATAAYGSSLHPHVNILRDFRDKYLMSNKIGREFIDFYNKYSPFLANIIAKSEPLQVIVRIHLVPIIVLSYSMVHLGPIITGVILLFISALPIFFISILRRKRS